MEDVLNIFTPAEESVEEEIAPIIETKEELEQYEEYKSMDEVEQSESIFHDKEVKIDGSLVAEEGECQRY